MRRAAAPSRRSALRGGLALAALAGLGSPAMADPRVRVAFIGDSMADGLWGAFVRTITRERCLKDRADGGRYARNGTGLTRPDSYDWPAQARKIAESYGPAAVVASIGLNDRQDLVEPGGRSAYGTPAWEAAYRNRIALLLDGASSGGAGVLVIGHPAMRDAAQNADSQLKNRLFAETIAAAGKPSLRYVEPWHPANAAPGAFASAAPGPTGSLVQVRAPDGIHFTAIGYDLVWASLYPKLVANLKDTGRELGPDCPSP